MPRDVVDVDDWTDPPKFHTVDLDAELTDKDNQVIDSMSSLPDNNAKIESVSDHLYTMTGEARRYKFLLAINDKVRSLGSRPLFNEVDLVSLSSDDTYSTGVDNDDE